MNNLNTSGDKGIPVRVQKVISFVFLLFLGMTPLKADEEALLIVPPPDITISCDYWFPFNENDPNAHIGEFDQRFGRIVSGPSRRNKIYVEDRVCPNHPRFNEFAPANPSADPCYDDTYNILWGDDGYVDGTTAVPGFQNIVPFLHCKRGYLIREWRAWPHDPVVATQKITIIDCREFYVPTVCWRFTVNDLASCDRLGADDYKVKLIEWPCNIDLTRCQATGSGAFDPDNLPVGYQDKRPRLAVNRCNLLAATYEDVQFNFVDSSCAKIFRTWTVIDWCLYEDFRAGNYFGEYEWSFTQVIKLLNSETPNFATCDDQTFCGNGDPNNPQSGQCSGVIELRPTYSDDCTAKNEIKIDYKVDLFDDGTIDQRGYSSNFAVNPFGTLPATRFPDTLANADGTYPVGSHKILWSAEDGCGNISSCQYLFTVQDCKPPTPYCRNGVSTIPMPSQAGGYVDIWAADYNIGSTDNCTATGELIYSFSDDPTDASRRLTAVDSGLTALTVYVWDVDVNGDPLNYATCSVTILVEPIGGQGTANRISGHINYGAREIDGATVYLRYANGEVDSTTTVNGNYAFYAFDTTQTATIQVKKDNDHRNGVSTLDLVFLAKHIVGSRLLDSPYKIIAGDVNGTGSLTTFDMIEMRKLILYINPGFPNNESWRFIPTNFTFADPSDPLASPIPYEFSINSLGNESNITLDFEGIKIGDLNQSARTGLKANQEAENRGAAATLEILDRQVTVGETIEVAFSASQVMNMSGYQLGLKFDPAKIRPIELVESELPGLGEANFGWDLVEKGSLTVSWHQAKAIQKKAKESLFTLRVMVKKSGRLSDVLSFGDELEAEYYQDDLQIRPLELIFVRSADPLFKVYNAQPNPFYETTVIGFNLPEAGTATLSIYDVAGKMLSIVEGEYSKGYNEVTVNRSELKGTGVLYYTLSYQNQAATKKMIIVE